MLNSSIAKRSYRYLRSFGLSGEQIIEASNYDFNSSDFVNDPQIFLRRFEEIPFTIARLRLYKSIPSQEEFQPKIISFHPSITSLAFHALMYVISSQFEENVIVLPVQDFLLHDIEILASKNHFYFEEIVHRWISYNFPDFQDSEVKPLAFEIMYRLLDGRAVALLQIKQTSMDNDSLFLFPKEIICMTKG